jgi:hypothetical protein
LLAERAYRGISPVIRHDARGVIRGIKNAALVNYPNLRGQVALHQESSMLPVDGAGGEVRGGVADVEAHASSAVKASCDPGRQGVCVPRPSGGITGSGTHC